MKMKTKAGPFSKKPCQQCAEFSGPHFSMTALGLWCKVCGKAFPFECLIRAVNAFDDLLEAAKLVIRANDPFYEGAVSDKDAMQSLISTVAKADVPHA
jgi:hypothetical protein